MREFLDLVEAALKTPAADIAQRFNGEPAPNVHMDIEAISDTAIWLSWFERNQASAAGDGLAVLSQLCQACDEAGVMIQLRVAEPDNDEGDDTPSALIPYYSKMGFTSTTQDEDGSIYMDRQPNLKNSSD